MKSLSLSYVNNGGITVTLDACNSKLHISNSYPAAMDTYGLSFQFFPKSAFSNPTAYLNFGIVQSAHLA